MEGLYRPTVHLEISQTGDVFNWKGGIRDGGLWEFGMVMVCKWGVWTVQGGKGK